MRTTTAEGLFALTINYISCAFGPGSIASRGFLLEAEAACRFSTSEWGALSGSSLKQKLRPGIDAQNGMHFPFELLAETVSRNMAPDWDALSGWNFKRKLCPGIPLQTGTHFPVEPLAESPSQNMAPERDTFSGSPLKRKLCPRIPSQNGMRFPPAACLENASQFEHLFRDAVSAERFNWKVCPVLALDSGTRFPLNMPFGKSVPVWQAGGYKLCGLYNSTSLSHVGRMVWRMPAVCSFFASTPAERTSFMVKRMSGWP